MLVELICRWLLHALLGDLDLGEAWFGMTRDVRESLTGPNAGPVSLAALSLAWTLPLASFVVMVVRERLAVIAIGPWLLALAYWFLYYADHWAAYYTEQNLDPAPSAALLPAFLILLGWSLLLITTVRPWRWGLWRAFREGLDPTPLLRGPIEQSRARRTSLNRGTRRGVGKT